MWSANQRGEVPDPEGTQPERQLTAPQSLAIAGEDWASMNVADPQRTAWRAELATLGDRSPLTRFVDAETTRIELSSTHPGGLARFITGAPTLLSQLIRDDRALRYARGAADRIVTKGLELSSTRGIDAIHLGVGLAKWRFEGEEYAAPILLRPIGLRRYGRDVELKLRGDARLNPAFARLLAEQYQIVLDPSAFVALTDANGTFKPNAVIDQLRALTGHLADFDVEPRLVVSSFAEVAGALAADAAELEHPVLDALAGNQTARWAIEEAYLEVDPIGADERDPSTDTLLLDADADQERAVEQIASGSSVVVTTMPGTGGTQTAVNAIGSLVARNKRVLVVSPRRATLREVDQRLAQVGLAGLVVTPATLRRDIVKAITRNERAKKPVRDEVDDALVRLRSVLLDYRGALHRPDEKLGVSVLDAVDELSRLALLPQPPQTTVRLGRETVERLAHDRAAVAATLREAARLGEFRYGPADSPWYGVSFPTGDDALRAHDTAKRLSETELPELIPTAQALVARTRMRPFESIGELGIYLRLLADIRETLDRFQPEVFDRSLSELIIATAPRREHPEMRGANRRRLRKLAKEYVRPGMHVADLNESLTRIQQQRTLWQRFVAPGAAPEVPTGIDEVQGLWDDVAHGLVELDAPLSRVTHGTELMALPLPNLTSLLSELAADSEALQNVQSRSKLLGRLQDLDLDALVADLANRHVAEDRLALELEQSWWRSALDVLLEEERALLGAKTEVLDRLEADFRLVDEAHAAGSAQALAWQLAENWKLGLEDWPDEAAALRARLKRGGLDSAVLHQEAPHLARVVAPVWAASPYDVPTISGELGFDTVILLDAGAISLAEAAPAIRRAKQVVAFGDPVTQTPAPFAIGLDEDDAVDEADDETLALRHENSALARLGSLLPTLELARSYRVGGEDLAELVNRRFYSDRIDSLPWAGSWLGHGSLRIDYVDGGESLPELGGASVESVEAEIARVIDLVVEHAVLRPHESLMVVTASEKHAAKVQQAVNAAMAARTELSQFVLADRSEPFLVTTIERAEAQSRDRVIFSLGYGRTPHGRILSDFGALGRPGGERLLAVAMTRARRSLSIVSVLRPDDVDESRMGHGVVALAEVLSEVDARRGEPVLPDESDPMLVDLARRLEARGLRTALGHRGKLGLVAAHGGTCIAVETDAVLRGRSLREALRLRPETLRRLGWHYARVHAFELFRDPDAVADRIARLAGLRPDPVTQEIPVAQPAPSA